jgi:hypothetical protein
MLMANATFLCIGSLRSSTARIDAFYITERGEPQGWLEINQLRSRIATSEQQVSKDGLRPEPAYAASHAPVTEVRLLILATRFLSDGMSALGQKRTNRSRPKFDFVRFGPIADNRGRGLIVR